MKRSILTKLLIALLTILFFIGCEENGTSEPANENILTMNDESYEVSTASLSQLETDGVWKLVIEATVTIVDKSVELTETNVTLEYVLHPLVKGTILGEYSIGDLNMDGMVNEDDAYNEGYITDAYYQKGNTTKQLVSGQVALSENTETGKRMATFDCRDEDNVRMQGRAEID